MQPRGTDTHQGEVRVPQPQQQLGVLSRPRGPLPDSELKRSAGLPQLSPVEQQLSTQGPRRLAPTVCKEAPQQ
jgi:hypothetical protein